MPNLKVVDMTGKEVGNIELSDAVFGAEVNADVLHTAVKVYLANQRQGNTVHSDPRRSCGGGRKPWRQKAPTRPSWLDPLPQWVKGGGARPKPRSYRLSPIKGRRIAIRRLSWVFRAR